MEICEQKDATMTAKHPFTDCVVTITVKPCPPEFAADVCIAGGKALHELLTAATGVEVISHDE